jgi:hypothetical protein
VLDWIKLLKTTEKMLEERCREVGRLERQLTAREKEVGEMRAALKQYAEIGNWNRRHRDQPHEPFDWWQPEGHGYEPARQALAGWGRGKEQGT